MKKRLCRRVSFLVAFIVLLSGVFGTAAFAVEYTGNYFSVGELIQQNNFNGGVGLPWHVVESDTGKAVFDISGGTYNVTINNPGVNRWDVQLRHRGLKLESGHKYTVKFTVTSSKACQIYPKIGDQGEPYDEYWNYNNKSWAKVDLQANVKKTVTETFTMNGTKDTVEFAFHLGGDCATSSAPYTLKFDEIYLTDPQFKGYPEVVPEPTNAIRVNQLGYFPNLTKLATYVSSSTTAQNWSLKDSSGKVVATGKTTVKGFDKSSGDDVHIIDFSSYKEIGTGYTLAVGSDDSLPFDIGTDMYSTMKYNAIKYFYHNRSGIAITMPYADRQDLTRPAGHPSDKLTPDPSKDYSASYTLDITGGWYDAGDHGKYVVNGGISTWTVMNMYERAKVLGKTSIAPYADNTMNIPESGNGLPDILDETRYNLKTLLKMQVPAGNTLAGMVHHKAHDEKWTALAVRPDQDEQPRWLQPPSTAATLNLAAIAAQGSRLWKEFDASFATTCLTAAETAWDAAVAHPNILASMEQESGGGAYGDDYVGDDFYWAACELYVTTGKAKYLDYIKSSKHYLEEPTELNGGEDIGVTGCFDWGNTAGLGTISLALVPSSLPTADVATAKANIKKAADKFISIATSQGYGVPIVESTVVVNGEKITGFPWGSNSFAVNEAIVMAYAYEFSGESKYLSGTAGVMDYILGRNPNVQSYVTGYGDNPLENPHHRFWAYQADNTFPTAPAGCLSGGPNSGLQDPWVKGSGWLAGSRAPEKCFMDHIESWSTNEVTINWNAPLAWVSAYLDEKGSGGEVITPGLLGDVNDDGTIDALDFAALKMYMLSGKEINLKNADVNKDGNVDAIDYAKVKLYLLGGITQF
ncbi:endoglucanase [Ruminiclostridium sufflavum DSM 19573]|uniref:Endoglucanase n=1 Tax=Ruminiclostridium sufflavum DSM 19573 TaxID=1121337 RepID=A0A318Y394_9FIRM|nr:glycoside hydrolase family 9 protein [Ruminiclostridium sufflavum]PYG86541.1 endoglucanase [Ruminiclostridium sufflavum DSM 19573]